ncbi:aminotransferase class I/II-fold pyridoxal phosphate-dependent enzyme [Variovorax ginsengisoli]|nr:aminotransferase class I/II-fold pyridoxal phosphate-dependent enzyme [Variovorax ginsengisoli]
MNTLQHGGPDAQGAAPHDFSTNGNGCGPCPEVAKALRQVSAAHYPDPRYTALRQQLAAFHAVSPARIVMAASASEFISRITAAVARVRPGTAVALPRLSYGDYARAAQAWGLAARCDEPVTADVGLAWHCEPSSPLGQSEAGLGTRLRTADPSAVQVIDRAYEPLRLDGMADVPDAALDTVWQLWTPNKALGLTGIRAAYAIAPTDAGDAVERVHAMAPSWPVGAHGVALLASWVQPSVQRWLDDSRTVLRHWKALQRKRCDDMGWHSLPSNCNFFVAAPPVKDVAQLGGRLRAHGVKLRDTASFGLPGHVRMAVLHPDSQHAWEEAWRAVRGI